MRAAHDKNGASTWLGVSAHHQIRRSGAAVMARRERKALTMKTMRAALVALLVMGAATAASAQTQPAVSGAVSGFTGQALGSGPGHVQNPTPLFVLGNMAFGIWTRVPPPYDVSANRNLAANPLP